jgi:hypothetical protein
VKQFVKKLRRLADYIEQGRKFHIQVAGVRVSIPADAIINIKHERGDFIRGDGISVQVAAR